MPNNENSSILLLLQSLNLLLKQDVKDREDWLPKFSGKDYKENDIAEIAIENLESQERKAIKNEIDEIPKSPTPVSEVKSKEVSNNTIPLPPLEESSSEIADSSSKPPTQSANGVISPSTPPPPPLPPLGLPVSPLPPRGPINLKPSEEKTDFFSNVASKFNPESFAIPEPSISPKTPSSKKIRDNHDENNIENQQNLIKAQLMENIIEIGLKNQIKLRVSEVYEAIISFNFGKLTYDAIEILLQNSCKQTPTSPGIKLEEMSYRNILDHIENGKEILKSMLFFKTFDSDCKRLENEFTKIKQVCESLLQSAKTTKFCQLVSNIMGFTAKANKNNSSFENGFKLETLSSFWEAKPFGGKSPMCLFIENLIQNNSETLTFYEDFEYLEGFICSDPAELEKDLKMLMPRLTKGKGVIEKLANDQADRNFDTIFEMIPGMIRRIECLEEGWDSVIRAYNDCLISYGQPVTAVEKFQFSLMEILKVFIKEFKLEKDKQEPRQQQNKIAIPTRNDERNKNETKKNDRANGRRNTPLKPKQVQPIDESTKSELEQYLEGLQNAGPLPKTNTAPKRRKRVENTILGPDRKLNMR